MKYIITISTILIVTFINTGCASSSGVPCDSRAKKYGFFCFHGKNFGKHKSRMYKLGVKDGCITGEGHFKKNYRYSRRYKDYVKGWIDGRRVCRSDEKKYKYSDNDKVRRIEDEYYSYRDEVSKYGL